MAPPRWCSEGLYRQLREGGRLVGVFARKPPPRATIVTHSHDDFGNRALFDATAPVLAGLERLPAFVFLTVSSPLSALCQHLGGC